MLTQEKLKRTPLYGEHVALQAKMVPFGGWEMPLQYDGILKEYQYTREGTAVFDTCHMGEFVIKGDCVTSGLDRIVTLPLKDMPLKSSRYGFMLNEKGGTIDDLIVFRVAEEEWFIVVNGATTEKDARHFRKYLKGEGVFEDVSLKTGKLDLQGPQSREVLGQWIAAVKELNYYHFDCFDLLGEKALISRTGYIGELGYEIFFPWTKIDALWKEFLKIPTVKPAGLGARDVLRLEMGYSLYGHELNEDITPLEAGLAKFIDFTKDFIGKEALLRQKEQCPSRILIGFTSDGRRSPRSGHGIFSATGEKRGVVTSGTFSPYLNRGIGVGFIEVSGGQRGEKIFFGDEKNKISAMITGKTFYKNNSLKT